MKVDTFFHPCFRCSLREICYPLKASYHMTKVLKDKSRQWEAVMLSISRLHKGVLISVRRRKQEENAN